MKKVMKVKEPVKKRKVTEKWILKEEDYTYEKQQILLSSLILNDQEKEKENIITPLIQQEIERKIASYKQQDLEKGKYDSKNTIQYNQVLNLLYETKCLCFYCKENVFLLYENVREKKQWTLDRIDNNLGHNTQNVLIACLQCNLKRRRQSKDGFLFTKQMIIVKEGQLNDINK